MRARLRSSVLIKCSATSEKHSGIPTTHYLPFETSSTHISHISQQLLHNSPSLVSSRLFIHSAQPNSTRLNSNRVSESTCRWIDAHNSFTNFCMTSRAFHSINNLIFFSFIVIFRSLQNVDADLPSVKLIAPHECVIWCTHCNYNRLTTIYFNVVFMSDESVRIGRLNENVVWVTRYRDSCLPCVMSPTHTHTFRSVWVCEPEVYRLLDRFIVNSILILNFYCCTLYWC